mmetsp:Transcript_19813/g.17511  ORF Transcript_19813/g.17511 Transcript_19813/m.17511 type:complete len:141 (+) Transcript_19813:518-940(+)
MVVFFESYANITSTITFFIFAISFWLTTGPCIYLYCGEVITDKGMSIATGVHWFFNAITEFLPIFAFVLVDWTNGTMTWRDSNSIFFFIFSGTSILGFFLITIFVKETKGRSRNEISELFGMSNYHSLTSTVSSKSSFNF